MEYINGIPVWGEHDAKTLEQIQRAARDERVAAAALMADGHLGYSVPIGGVLAYRDAVSPSGVGYDISCLAAGTPVTTEHGYYLPIEQIRPESPITCWDGGRVRPVHPNLGAIQQGIKPTLNVMLSNGRVIRATDDHQILTSAGWRQAGQLAAGDLVACNPFVGLPYEQQGRELAISLPKPSFERELAERGLYPLRTDSDLFPIVVRLLAYVSGDGHLSKNGQRISIYTTSEIDAVDLANDIARLGYRALVYRRSRHPQRRPEIGIHVNSEALHALFAALGSPVGKKTWPAEPMPWLLGLAPWVRAQFLSAFCSAEMVTPRLLNSHMPNLQLKQAGEDRHAIDFIARLLQSLDFDVSVATSGQERGLRRDYVLQILGGEAEQLRFFAEVGFCYAYEKRVRAAQAASACWQRAALVRNRELARDEARRLKAAGVYWKDILTSVSEQYAVSSGFVYHAVYDTRGTPRKPFGVDIAPVAAGEMCWTPVERVEAGDTVPVYDVLTDDPAHAFFASGIVVHNCGNKAARTDLRAADLKPNIKQIMDQVARTVVFGMGQTSGKAADHELFDDPTWSDIPQVGKLKQLAREQLGTVGSGNHYVDLFEDEEGWVWIGVHFGSRGLGHRTASGFLNLAAGRAFDDRAPGEHMDQAPTVLSLRDELGQAYWQAMTLAGRYAYAGRDFVVSQVLEILGAKSTDEIHNHHNFCIAGTELVPTPSGPKRMDEIASGDTIYTWDPQIGLLEAPVTNHWYSGEKLIYTIETASRRIRVSGDHPILVIHVESLPHPSRPWFAKQVGSYIWKKAQDIQKGDIVVCAEGYYPCNVSIGEGTARLIGAFLGDGWIRHNTSNGRFTVGLAIGGADEEHTERYRSLVEQVLPPVRWHSNQKGAYGLTCSSRAVWEAINALGLAGRSKTKRAPSHTFGLVREEKLALLAGYFDSDGSVGVVGTGNQGRGTAASTSRALVSDLREIAISCGLAVTPVRMKQRETNFGAATIYSCGFRAGAMSKLALWHTKKRTRIHIAHRDQHALASEKIGYLDLVVGTFAQYVRKVTVSDPEPVYDLSIDHPSHAFVCEGIIVHNCWRETHNGEQVVVVRKGATPAMPGQRSFIGGSMGDTSVIVEGLDSEASQVALRSTVHGAGRVMSRTQAAGKRRWVKKDGRRVQEIVRPGQISREMMQEWLRREGVELRGGGTDESPHVYRRLPEVLALHAGTIRVLHTLRPLGVVMAGEDIFDPYKD